MLLREILNSPDTNFLLGYDESGQPRVDWKALTLAHRQGRVFKCDDISEYHEEAKLGADEGFDFVLVDGNDYLSLYKRVSDTSYELEPVWQLSK